MNYFYVICHHEKNELLSIGFFGLHVIVAHLLKGLPREILLFVILLIGYGNVFTLK